MFAAFLWIFLICFSSRLLWQKWGRPSEQEIHTIIMLFLSISNIHVYNFNKKWDKIIKNNNFAFLCFYRVGSLSTFIVKMVSEEKTLNVNQNCGYKKLLYPYNEMYKLPKIIQYFNLDLSVLQ